MFRRRFFYQDQTNGGDGGGGGGGGGGQGGGGGGGGQVVERPAYVPEQFWDATKKAPNIEALGKGYIDTHTELTKLKTSAPKVPDKYELKLADGALLKPEAIERTAATARSLGLSQESAQKALDFANGEVKTYHESIVADHTARVAKWGEELKANKEIFGANEAEFKKNIELAHRAAKHFGGDDLLKELNASGYGNHPLVVSAFLKMGRLMGEDGFEKGNQGGGNTARDPAQVLYGEGSQVK